MEINEAYALLSKDSDSALNQKIFLLLKKMEMENLKLRAKINEREIELCEIAKETGFQSDSFLHPNFTHK